MKKKSEMILDYKYKAGVDVINQMVSRYTTKLDTNRWPIAMFYHMLDIAALAPYILYSKNNKMLQKKTKQR